MTLTIGGFEPLTLIDFPGKIAAIIFTVGCNLRCPYCFTGDQIVFTNNGRKKIKDIVESDEDIFIYGNDGKFNKVTQRFTLSHSGDMIKIKTSLNDEILQCTPNHELFVYDKMGVIKKKAINISPNDYIGIKIPEGTKKVILKSIDALKSLYIPIKVKDFDIDKNKVKELLEKGYSWRKIGRKMNRTNVKNSYYGIHKLIIPQIKQCGNNLYIKGGKNSINKKFVVDKDFARLIGYYLAEGNVHKEKNRKNSYTTSFTFNKKEKKYINDVKKLMKKIFKINMSITHNIDCKTTRLSTSIGPIGMFLKYYFGDTSHNKKIPNDFLYLNKMIQKELILGAFSGDGINSAKHIKKYQQQRYTSVSRNLLDSFSLILFRNHIRNSRFRDSILISDKKIFKILGQHHLIKKKTISVNNSFKWGNGWAFLRVQDVSKEKVKNKLVYNLGVNESHHSYNIFLFAVSNCYNKDLITKKWFEESERREYCEEKILKYIKKNKSMLDGVVITGGEPTMQKSLVSFCKKLKEMGMAIKIDTNGTNPELLNKLIRAELVDYVAMDVKAPLSKYSLVGYTKDTAPIAESIKIIKESGLDHEFRTTMHPSLKLPDYKKICSLCNGSKLFIQDLLLDVPFLDETIKDIPRLTDEDRAELKKMTCCKCTIRYT